MPKIYFINLDRSNDRREWFLRQAERLGLDTERVPAVDARELDDAELSRWRAVSSGRNSLSASEIACLLSHRRCWQRVLDDGEEWAFINEDDAHLCGDMGNFLKNPDWIPPDADLIHAETNLKKVEMSRIVYARPFGREVRLLKSLHYGSAAYFVSRSAARTLLDFTLDHCEPADQILFSPQVGMLRRLKVFQVMPALCLQDYLCPSPVYDSIIYTDRTHFHRSDARSARVRGLRKLPRELFRLAEQFKAFWRRLYLSATRQSVFRKVTFEQRPPS